uniref:Zn(2)-C6 fungal-type domain-containing protein n=1 Tax=Mycena chlorophos TaxID=658473 RepID=A0ABQ0KUM1_MYCCL|nr:predicted protein [Mycena chlorophos]
MADVENENPAGLVCDSCKASKKKCDRRAPCDSCTKKNLSCVYTKAPAPNAQDPAHLPQTARVGFPKKPKTAVREEAPQEPTVVDAEPPPIFTVRKRKRDHSSSAPPDAESLEMLQMRLTFIERMFLSGSLVPKYPIPFTDTIASLDAMTAAELKQNRRAKAEAQATNAVAM